jgi:hypothetical protein
LPDFTVIVGATVRLSNRSNIPLASPKGYGNVPYINETPLEGRYGEEIMRPSALRPPLALAYAPAGSIRKNRKFHATPACAPAFARVLPREG